MIVSDLALIEGSCTSEQSMLEATILATLGRPLKWSIAAHQLTLTPADATVPSLQWRDTPDGNINPVTSLATDTSTATTLHSPA